MKKLELTYTEIQEIIERVFIFPTNGRPPLNKDYCLMFRHLSKERVLAMQHLAQKYKRYEEAYKKSTNKFHWCLDHAIEYEKDRESFVHHISYYMPKDILHSLEDTRKSLQESHKKDLKDCVKKQSCRWISTCEVIEVQGLRLTRGLFYSGYYFKIPQSYKKIKTFDPWHRDYREYNRNYKLSKLYGTVIHEKLPISKENLKIDPFSSYLDMHPTHRFEYLEWLAGHKHISDISSETFLFYLMGLQLRMFIDDTTTEKDRLEILNCSVDLYNKCQDNNLYCVELVAFIDATVSKFFISRLKELVPKDIIPHLSLCREALIISPHNNNNSGSVMENICRNIMCILNYNDSIQEHLLTNSFYVQFADMVESELMKMSYKHNWEELQNIIIKPESSNHYELYHINNHQNYTMLLYDYIFTFKLFPNIYSLKFFNQCINNCFKRIVKRIGEYSILVSELPSQASSTISLFDTDYKNIHTKIHRIITEGEDFTTIEGKTDVTEYTIDKVSTANSRRVSLCDERLEKVERQTKQAQDFLADIFKDNDERTASTNQENNELLDILRILLTKDSWTRNDVEMICKKRHLMIGSVLERINDFSYSKVEDGVIEDDGETIYVTTKYKDKLI